MDSTLGKILSSILGLLAIAGVVMLGVYGLDHHKTDSAVADVASLAVNVRASYVNNPAGYASLTNAVAVGAGDVPASMLKGGQIVNAWGSSVTLGPVPGQPKDFSINLGTVPQPACVQLLTADASLMGAQVGGKQVALPVDPAAAATACAGAATATGVPMTVQYGQSKVSVVPPCAGGTQSLTVPGTYQVKVPAGCSTVAFEVLGAGGGGGYLLQDGTGGAGARVTGTLPEPGAPTLTITVGAGGAVGLDPYQAGSGGGFSAIQDASGYAVVAGGGGGAGGYGGNANGQNYGYGGGGGAAGLVGANGSPGCDPRTAGNGATQAVPGAATPGYPQEMICSGNAAGNAGLGMAGGAPVRGAYGNGGGGGGGSGYFGGGSGASGGSFGGGGGGGGGSSYASLAAMAVSITSGGAPGGSGAPGTSGRVSITFKP